MHLIIVIMLKKENLLFYCMGKLLLGKLLFLLHGEIVVGEVASGEISDWENCCWSNWLFGKLLLGKLRWGNNLTVQRKNVLKEAGTCINQRKIFLVNDQHIC